MAGLVEASLAETARFQQALADSLGAKNENLQLISMNEKLARTNDRLMERLAELEAKLEAREAEGDA